MDANVLAAIAKWPNVPAVFGWLQLTARGEWRLRAERIDNAAIREFIGRNYALDEHGRAFFQNGPQRVFVDVERAPWVYRVAPDGVVSAHTGARPRRCDGAVLLDDGGLALVTEFGVGGVDDRDVAHAIQAVTDHSGMVLNERGFERWLDGRDEAFIEPRLLALQGERTRIERLRAGEVAKRFNFQKTPRENGARSAP